MEAYNGDWFGDSYIIRLVLRKENGEIYREEHDNMSLTDFEVLYGNISDELIEIDMKLKRDEELFDGVIVYINKKVAINKSFKKMNFNSKNVKEIEELKETLIKEDCDLLMGMVTNTLSNKVEILTIL